MATPIVLSSLSRREAIIDALYRIVLGLDTNDAAMFHSAMTQDMIFDLNGTVLAGLDVVDEKILRPIGPMETTHTISNVRVDAKDGADTATMTAYAMAQHCRQGEGSDPAGKKLMTGGLYYFDLVEDKQDGLWKIKKWSVKLVWRDGDRSVMQR